MAAKGRTQFSPLSLRKTTWRSVRMLPRLACIDLPKPPAARSTSAQPTLTGRPQFDRDLARAHQKDDHDVLYLERSVHGRALSVRPHRLWAMGLGVRVLARRHIERPVASDRPDLASADQRWDRGDGDPTLCPPQSRDLAAQRSHCGRALAIACSCRSRGRSDPHDRERRVSGEFIRRKFGKGVGDPFAGRARGLPWLCRAHP